MTVFPPDHFVSTPGGDATFRCLSVSGDQLVIVQWFINGTLLENLNLKNVEIALFPTTGSGSLRFTDLPHEYNMTRIRCRATFSSGTSATSSDSTVLLLQGI